MPKRIDKQKPYTPPPAFKTMAEVHAYLALEPLPCLLCGKGCRALESHLRYQHEMSVPDYQMMFGIPRSLKLIAPSLKRQFSEQAHKLRQQGKLWLGRPDQHPNFVPRKPRTLTPRVEAIRRSAREIRMSQTWQDYHYTEFLNRMAQGRSIDSVGTDQDMPCRASFYKHLKNNHEFKKRFYEVMDQLPFDQQLRSHYTSEELKQAVMDLHAQGCNAKEISWHLEIPLPSTKTLLRKFQLVPEAHTDKVREAL